MNYFVKSRYWEHCAYFVHLIHGFTEENGFSCAVFFFFPFSICHISFVVVVGLEWLEWGLMIV